MPLPASWSAEILPPIDDPVSAVTQLTSLDTATAMLTAQPMAPLTATFTFISPAVIPVKANVTLTIPPKIPGLPERIFEVRANLMVQPLALTATFSAPLNATHGGGVIRLIPIPPYDEDSPPRAFTVGPASSFAFTVTTSDDVPLLGRLRDAMGERPPNAPFVVRAFQDDLVVSDTPFIDDDGTFTLSIPLSASIQPVRVQMAPVRAQIAPQPGMGSHPSYLTTDRTLGSNGAYPFVDVTLPTYINIPNAFSLAVAGESDGFPPIPGALVRATTVLPQPDAESQVGSASFVRDSLTNEQGLATLSLLPGTAVLAREYEVAVVPPAGSEYATLCRRVSIAAGGLDGSPPGMVQLNPPRSPRRPVFTGRVLDADGAPVGDVAIVATPGPDPATNCTTTRPVTAKTVSNRLTGSFRLPVDPGNYQIDYDPPGGSGVPRMTEVDVAIGADVSREVHLPKPAFVEGTVVAADGRTALAGAMVRLYEVRCVAMNCTGPGRVAPWLRGVAQTDGSGRFRAIVALDTSN
jgi:hypothetical protein